MSLAIRDRVLLVVGRDHAEHRAEDLLLGDRRASCRRCRRRSARRSSRGRGASGRPPPVASVRALVDALGDVALDPVALALGRPAGPSGSRRRTGRRRAPARTSPASASTSSSWRLRVTTIRVSDEQTWPDRKHSAPASVGRGLARSMSSRMTAADLPPSSSVQRAIRSPQIDAIRRPAAVEPVNVILSTRGSRTSSSETSRSAVTTLSTPGGRPICLGDLGDDVALARRLRRRLQHDRAAGEQRRARSCSRSAPSGRVPRDDRADDADRLADEQAELAAGGRRAPAPRTGTCRPGRRSSRTCAARAGAAVLRDRVAARRTRAARSGRASSAALAQPGADARAGTRPARRGVSRGHGPSSNACAGRADGAVHVGGLRLGDA